MKVLLDIKDEKAEILLDMLKGLSFVKATRLDKTKERIYGEWQEAMKELRLIKAGKKRGRPISVLLNGR